MLNLEEQKLIFNKYKVKNLIFASGFAEVYEGINEKDNLPVAIKLENRRSKYNILESEAFYLMNLKGYGIPKLITYGYHSFFNVLIEELLGLSIGQIVDEMKSNKMNLKDVSMIALQSLDRLEFIHSKLVIHRDIKPHNFVIGRNDPNVIYLIDFGLSRKYRSSRTGKHIKYTNLKLTFGSLRFLSINGNKGYEQSRRDDLESLGYMLIYLATGNLPWIKAENVNFNVVKKYLFIYKIKKSISSEKLCKGLPEEMFKYIEYCKGLYFEEDPDYNYLRTLFQNILIKINQRNDLRFFWITKRMLEKMNDNDKIDNKDNSKNKYEYKNIIKRSVSPHIRLLHKIQNALEQPAVIDNTNTNIGSKSQFQQPITALYKDNENNNEKEKENENGKECSLIEGEYKNVKNNIENESTKEKDLKTDKSLSQSYDRKEQSKFKRKKKKVFIYGENNIITENKNEIKVENKNSMNFKKVNDNQNNIIDLNYQDSDLINKEERYNENENIKINKLNDIINDSDKNINIDLKNETTFEKDIRPLIIENKTSDNNKFKNIKFISNNIFWDDDNSETNDEDKTNKYNTYRNIDLKSFGIFFNNNNSHRNQKLYKQNTFSNLNNQNQNIKINNNINYNAYKNKNMDLKANMNLKKNNKRQKTINNNNNYNTYGNNNLILGPITKCSVAENFKNENPTGYTRNKGQPNIKNQQMNKSINNVKNIRSNKFQQKTKKKNISYRNSKEKINNEFSNKSISPFKNAFGNKNLKFGQNLNIRYRKMENIKNSHQNQNNNMKNNSLYKSHIILENEDFNNYYY